MPYHNHTVSVVMPAYNERSGIAEVVNGFIRLPFVDEVVVADNNSTDGTGDLAARAGARVVREEKQGYGYACRRALLEAQHEYVVLVESDRTFRPADIEKLLVYAEEFDVVFGTRTSKTCIWSGANMGYFLRYGNCAVAKLLEYVHNGPCLTDVGCTFKFIWRESLRKIQDRLTVGGSHFSPEFMIAAIRSGLRCIEVPVHYRGRTGHSKITGSFWPAFKLGCVMIGLILHRRFMSYPRVESAVAPAVLNDLRGVEGTEAEDTAASR